MQMNFIIKKGLYKQEITVAMHDSYYFFILEVTVLL